MSQLGQAEKNSLRAYVFRFAPDKQTFSGSVGTSQRCPLGSARSRQPNPHFLRERTQSADLANRQRWANCAQ
jgi:hypothetical protein